MPSLKYSKRLAAATAVAPAIAAAPAVSAAVQTVNVDIHLTPSSFVSFQPTAADFVSGYNSDDYTAAVGTCFVALYNFDQALYSIAANGAWDPILFSPGEVVGPDTPFFASSLTGISSSPSEPTPLYFGYQMLNQGSGNDETWYGYISLTQVAPSEFTFNYYSYNTVDNVGITVIPEPGIFGVACAALALACIGLRRAFRRT